MARLEPVGSLAMSLDMHRIAWMPSPPLVPDDGAISLDHLRRMTLGDADLEREVLEMFATQAGHLFQRLATSPDDASAIAHTLKGSARAIGALDVAEAAAVLELAIRDGRPAAALVALGHAITQARAAIADILAAS